MNIMKDCPSASNLHNDVRLIGCDHKEHDENLDKVMYKFEEHGLTLNYEKCEIRGESMKYMGEVITGEESPRREWKKGQKTYNQAALNSKLDQLAARIKTMVTTKIEDKKFNNVEDEVKKLKDNVDNSINHVESLLKHDIDLTWEYAVRNKQYL